jgi:hypothetical protein
MPTTVRCAFITISVLLYISIMQTYSLERSSKGTYLYHAGGGDKDTLAMPFTDEEYQRMQMGTIPQEMEDKWFIYSITGVDVLTEGSSFGKDGR